jgi:hypothetical protein
MLATDMKIKNAYILKDLYKSIDLREGIFSNIVIEIFNLENLMNTDFYKKYIEILENNGIFLNETDREILRRLLHGEVLNYK